MKIQAYSEEDGISSAQEDMGQAFAQNKIQLLQDAAKALLQFCPNASSRYAPQSLLFQRSGTCALLLSDKGNPENGLALQLLPVIKIFPQDEYL